MLSEPSDLRSNVSSIQSFEVLQDPPCTPSGQDVKGNNLGQAISLFSGTAFALSNAEWFKGIFGSSIYLVEDQILFSDGKCGR